MNFTHTKWTKPEIARECAAADYGSLVGLGLEFSSDEPLADFIIEESDHEIKVDWDATFEPSRSKRYRLNAWLYLLPRIDAAQTAGENEQQRVAQRVMRFAHDWSINHPYDPAKPIGSQLQNKFAWYDMSTGLRASVIGYLLARSGCGNGFSDLHLQSLHNLAEDHAAYLMREDLWSRHSNHGYFQSTGLFAMVAQAPTAFENPDNMRRIAIERTAKYLRETVSKDGLHLEHSPYYHSFIFASVAELAPWLNNKDPLEAEISNLYTKMQLSMAAYYMPNGMMVPFGDSRFSLLEEEMLRIHPRVDTLEPDFAAIFKRDALSAHHSSLVSKKTGLVIDKKWKGESDSYFALTAQYHSGVHKQVDDMSVFWAEDAMPILSDPGRYGYEGETPIQSDLRKRGFIYSDPKRIYVESAHAHNVVEIDGMSDDRRQTPKYQSAVVGTASTQDTTVVICERARETLVGHRRVVIHRPGDYMIIFDHLTSMVNRPHKIDQWLQFFPAWDVKPGKLPQTYRATYAPKWREEFTKTYDKQTKGMVMRIERHLKPPAYDVGVSYAGSEPIDSRLVAGKTEPRLEGWASLAPLTLSPTCAVSFGTNEPTTAVKIASVIQKIGPREKLSPLRLEVTSTGDTLLSFELRGNQISWRLVEEEGQFRVEESQNDDVINILIAQNETETRLRQSNDIMKARAHIHLGSPAETVYAFFSDACKPFWGAAAIEAAEYAQTQGDTAEEITFLRAAAGAGDANGSILLARALLGTIETEEEFLEVEALLQKGAQDKIRSAYVYLGKLYEKKGSFQNLEKAEEAYRQGAQMGHLPSVAGLGQLLASQNRVEEALPWLEIGLENGNAASALKYGDIYRKGEGVEIDFDFALKGYRIAMDAGSRNAFYFAAQILNDTGFDGREEKEARLLLEEAARRGVMHATFDLGVAMISNGNAIDGMENIKQAAEAGSNKAIRYMKDLEETVSDV